LLISGGCLWTPEGGILNDIDILVPSDQRQVRTAQEKAALLAEVALKVAQYLGEPDLELTLGT
jgi:hypothetical protein